MIRALPAIGLLALLIAWASEPTAGALGILLAQGLADMGRELAGGIAVALVVLATGIAGAGCLLAKGEADARRIAARYVCPLPPASSMELVEGEYYYE